MTIESFIRAMPKVELYVQLEGGMQKETLLLMAEQNEVIDSTKHFSEWTKLLDKPNYDRLDEITRVTSSWIQYPEDLTRIAYDLGVILSKQNVRYAEVGVNPTLYMQNGLSFEGLMEALSDGRDRAQRGWGVRMNWILNIPRDEPRKGDDVARWATSATAKKAGIVALGLTGRDNIQPVGQFERAFRTSEKKGLARVAQAGDTTGAEGIVEAIQALSPDRLLDGWGAADAPDVLRLLKEQGTTLVVSMARALCLGWTPNYASYPLRSLFDEQVKLCLGVGMPSLYKTTLSDEYLAAVEHGGFTIEELQELAMNAVRASLLSPEEKEVLEAEFTQAYQELHAEHVSAEQAT